MSLGSIWQSWLRPAVFWKALGRWSLILKAAEHICAEAQGGGVAAVRHPLKVLGGVAQPVPELGRMVEQLDHSNR